MQILFIFLIHLLCCIIWINGKFNENFCDKMTFYKPYVKVYNEKGGDLILNADSGFRTFQSVSNAYVCVNGPAIFYSDIGASNDGERVFQDARFGLFVHDCSYLNAPRGPTVPRPALNSTNDPKCNTSRVTTTQQMFLNPLNNSFIPPNVDFTLRVWGVYMLGSPNDYRLPQIIQFNEKNFESRADLVFPVDHTKPPPRTAANSYGLSFVTIGNISSCISLPDGPRNLVLPKLTDPDNQICFRPQTADDPDFIAPPPVDENGTLLVIPTGCNDTTAELTVTGCTTFPNLQDECIRRRPNVTLTCHILKIIIGEEIPQFPPELNWHTEVLELLDEIFMGVCPGISRHFITTVSTLTDYYVSETYRVAANSFPRNEMRRPFWRFIINSLKECRSRVTPFQFNEVEFKTTNQYKRDILFRNMTPTGDVNVRLFYFTELADREFDFNRILEMQWTIFATVLGICPRYYNAKTASISSRLYTMFSEDFLIPLSSIWVNPDHNVIYELLLGQFINDKTKVKAETCLEAAYVQSNTLNFRYQRPLTIDCGEQDNYFLELPTPQFYIPRG